MQRWLVQTREDLDSQGHEAVAVPPGVLETVVQTGPLAVGVGGGAYTSKQIYTAMLVLYCEHQSLPVLPILYNTTNVA